MDAISTGTPASAARRKFVVSALALALTLPLSGCGDSEADQRKAFIEFLNTRIVAKKGVHLPIMSEDNRKAFGPYAVQFDIISGFNRTLNKAAEDTLGGFNKLTAEARSLQELMSRKEDLKRLRDGVAQFSLSLKAQLDAANAARAALPPQPDDLKSVYAVAFERDVTGPAAVMLEAFPIVADSIAAMLEAIDFVEAHRAAITVDGSLLTTSDASLTPQLNAVLEKLNDRAAKTQAVYRKAQELINGD